MSPRQEDLLQVTVQGTRREDVVRLLKKALTHVENGGLGMSEHPNDYDPFLSVMAPTSWRRGEELKWERVSHGPLFDSVLQVVKAYRAGLPAMAGIVLWSSGLLHVIREGQNPMPYRWEFDTGELVVYPANAEAVEEVEA